jgi:hypothetical protein
MLTFVVNACFGIAAFAILGFIVLWFVDHTDVARTHVARCILKAIPKVPLFFFLIRGIWPSLPISWQIGLALGGTLVFELTAAEFSRLSSKRK